MPHNLSKNLEIAIKAALKAGEEIMAIYTSKNFEVEFKNDNSPLTKADKISHQVISDHLSKTQYPLLSEEGASINYEIRKNWNKFWLIDPIDGTKEFIKRNGEFTVNIALIENNAPVLGVVYCPALKILYFSEKEKGSFKILDISLFEEIDDKTTHDLSESAYPDIYTMVVSKSHMNDDTQSYVDLKEKEYGQIETASYGSSLKICKVADGSAHCYPRFGPTMEWDTAAAHAIALFANCKITQADEVTEVIYNKKNLLNPYFIISN